MKYRWRKILVVINPRAGRWGSERSAVGIFQRIASETETPLEIRTVHGSQDARTWAQFAHREGFDLIAVVGGDGTVHEVVNGMLHSKSLPLAVIPCGTTNALARTLGLPRDLQQSIAAVFFGTTRLIDLGHLASHDRYFIGAVSIGYGSAIISDARQELKNLLGYPAYAVAALRHIIKIKTATFSGNVDACKYHEEAQMLVVANIGFESLHLRGLGPSIRVDDGCLDLVVFRHRNFQAILELLAGLVWSPAVKKNRLMSFRGKSATVAVDPALPILVDGEACEPGEIRCSVLPKRLEIVVPKNEKTQPPARKKMRADA